MQGKVSEGNTVASSLCAMSLQKFPEDMFGIPFNDIHATSSLHEFSRPLQHRAREFLHKTKNMDSSSAHTEENFGAFAVSSLVSGVDGSFA